MAFDVAGWRKGGGRKRTWQRRGRGVFFLQARRGEGEGLKLDVWQCFGFVSRAPGMRMREARQNAPCGFYLPWTWLTGLR